MAPSRFQRTSAVLLAAALVAASSAVDFGGENDITQSAGTVAPGGETQTSTTGSYDSPNQWTQMASSSNNVPTIAPSAPSSVSGSKGWSQPPTSGVSSSSGNQGWTPPTSTGGSNSWTPTSSGTGDYSLECSGSDESTTPTSDYSLECSGSDKTTEGSLPSVSTSAAGSSSIAPTSTTAPTTSSGTGEQITSTAGSSNVAPTSTTAPTTSSGTGDQTGSLPSSTASSSNTATSAASCQYKESSPITSTASSSNTMASTASSGTGNIVDQGSSQETAQTPSTASSSNTAQSMESSSNTAQSTASSSNTASSSMQEGSDAAQTSTNSTSSGDHATFGTVTSKSGECVIGNPNKYVSTADIAWIWENRIGPSAPMRDANWNVMDNKNWIMDHLVKNKGSLNYCIRWDSDKKLAKDVTSKLQPMLTRQHAAWNHWLIGYNCWPYDEIKVNVVGFAVKDASLLEWTDDSLGPITVGHLDPEGVPQCDQSCSRTYDSGTSSRSDTSSCKGEPFDVGLWLKQGLEGGFSYDLGQEVNLENMLSTIDQDELVIVAHEIGHGFGLPDFYEVADKPNADWPKCIMMAGSSMTVTDSDGWMLRRVLEHMESRYNF